MPIAIPVPVLVPAPHLQRRRLRAVLMRAGTSKGLFLRLEDLPADRSDWTGVILAAMGSPDPFSRQLDGLGGGTSTQSKVAVVSRSKDPRADVDYLFIQVPVDGVVLDFSGNCGNMASGCGPFAVDEGLLHVKSQARHDTTVRIRNVNTGQIIHSTFAVEFGLPTEHGGLALDGVSSLGSPVRLDFLDPAGAMTGKLLPTGSPMDEITLMPLVPLVQVDPNSSTPVPLTMTTDLIAVPTTYHVSCVDSANPFVFVDATELGVTGTESADELMSIQPILMEIRARASVLMGLADTVEIAKLTMGTPKIAIVAPSCDYITPSGRLVLASEIDIVVRPFSMGNPHPTIQMTGAVCVASACSIPGTLTYAAVRGRDQGRALVVGHASGTMTCDGDIGVGATGQVEIIKGSVYRTARRLMEGSVLYQG